MKLLKRLTAMILALGMLCSCAAPANDTVPLSGETLVDRSGRTVEMPEDNDRIACLYAYNGHVAVLLGCEDNITAVVDGLKRDKLMQDKIPNISEMLSPYSSGAINIEELAAVSPDLIFLRESNLQDEGELSYDEVIYVGENPIKAVYQDYRSIVLAIKDGDRYRMLTKDKLKCF